MKAAKTNINHVEQARANVTFNGKKAIMTLDWEKPSRFYLHVRGNGLNKVIDEEYDPRAILLSWTRAMKKYAGELVARTPKQRELLQKQHQLAASYSPCFAPTFLRVLKMAELKAIRRADVSKNHKQIISAFKAAAAASQRALQSKIGRDWKVSKPQKIKCDSPGSEYFYCETWFRAEHSDGSGVTYFTLHLGTVVDDEYYIETRQVGDPEGGPEHPGRADWEDTFEGLDAVKALKNVNMIWKWVKPPPKRNASARQGAPKKAPLAVGTKVRYTAKFLKSTGMPTQWGSKVGVIKSMGKLGGKPLAMVDWKDGHEPMPTLAINLNPVGKPDQSAASVQGAEGDKAAYKAYFDKKMKQWGIKSPTELDDAKKKKFFEEVDKGWKADNEKKEGAAARDYAKEYKEYHSKPEQIKNRAKRNSARRKLGLQKGDNREVDHKTPLSKGGGNGKANLRAVSRKTNRQKGSKAADTRQGLGGRGRRAPRDPVWINARYPGRDIDGKPFKKGARVLYWPNGKRFMQGPKAEQAWKDFQAQIADEIQYNM